MRMTLPKGVKQGSVLSPALFLLVLDPLLRELQRSGLGLSINNFYAGGFLHADDVRTLATSKESLEAQVALVKRFAEMNFLKLNVAKCEIVMFSRGHSVEVPECEVDGSVLPAGDVGKCLGFWWKGDLLATRSVDENVKKARRAFFHYGSIGAFQGDLSPLSSRSILDACVMPVLMYGCENWLLTHTLVEKLESFQAELAKRVLKWPKHHSNTAALVAVGMQSVKSRILERKLGFLHKVLGASSGCVSGRVVDSWSDSISSLCLVKECRELEEMCGVAITEKLMKGELVWSRSLKDDIRRVDRERLLERCMVKVPIVAEVEERVGWARMWDATLNFGVQHTRALQMLSRVRSHHGRGDHPCPLCDAAPLDAVMSHVLRDHCMELGLGLVTDSEQLLHRFVDLDLTFLAKFRNLYKY